MICILVFLKMDDMFFDTVYLGKRTLCYIDISRIVV